MAIEDYQKMRGEADRRRQFTLDTMPAEIEEGLLALADSYEKEGGADD